MDMPRPAESEPDRSQSTEMFVDAFARGLQVIRSFSDGPEKQTLSDIARRADISRASARRLLHTLLQLQYVHYDGKYFSLKPKIMDLGYSYISSMDLAGVAQDAMNELSARMNFSCSLAVLDGIEIVYVVRATMRVETHCTHVVGNRIPAHVLAMGRVLLAAQSDEMLENYFATVKPIRYTPYTTTDPVQLRQIIREDGERGLSIVRRERNEGICGMAMPISGKYGETIAALGIGIRPDLSTDPVTIENTRRELARTVDSINGLLRLRA